MSRIAKRPTKIKNGMCEHGCCDGCPHGCFDEPSSLDVQMYDEFQKQLRAREFCIGWHPIDSQRKTYYEPLYNSWHEANEHAKYLANHADPSYVYFVEAVTNTKKCLHCENGKDEEGDTCGYCHGKGRVRA